MGIKESTTYIKQQQPHSDIKLVSQQAKMCKKITNLQIYTH